MSVNESKLLDQVTTIHPSYQQIKQMFDRWGGSTYDKDLIASENYPAPLKLFSLLIPYLEKTSTVIDFACGTGISGHPFIKTGHTVDGIDFSQEMIKEAKEKGYRDLWEKNLISDDLSGFNDYDLAICVGVLGQFIPVDFAIPFMTASTNENGLIGFTIQKGCGMRNSLTKKILENNGLELKESEEGQGYHLWGGHEEFYYVVAQKK